jgi:transcriptional regulator with XRE-family HTH domain
MLDSKQGGAFLKRRRLQLELTLDDLSRELHINSGDISRMENGRITSPSLERAVLLGKQLGFTPNQVAAAYGLWSNLEKSLEERWTMLGQNLAKLPQSEQGRVLDAIEALITVSQAKSSRF